MAVWKLGQETHRPEEDEDDEAAGALACYM
jgi:hypothetical protein